MKMSFNLFEFLGTGTTIFLGGLFGGPKGGDGQTILDLAGTGTTIFLGGLFRGVNS